METTAFVAGFNARAEEIGHDLRIASWTPGERADVAKINERVSILFKDDYAQVIAGADGASVADALVAYCTILDIMTGATKKARNGWLERLGLFDGGIRDGRPKTTMARGWTLEFLPHNPGMRLFSMVIKKEGAKRS